MWPGCSSRIVIALCIVGYLLVYFQFHFCDYVFRLIGQAEGLDKPLVSKTLIFDAFHPFHEELNTKKETVTVF